MSNLNSISQKTPVQTPCIGVCTLHELQFCIGCWRTTQEITNWVHYSDDQRRYLMEVVLPQREMIVNEAGCHSK